MNEIEDMRDALTRAETNLERMRWVLSHPRQALYALERVLRNHGEQAGVKTVADGIDSARNNG